MECNLACKHCYLDARKPHQDELSLEEGIRFIDELAELEIPIGFRGIKGSFDAALQGIKNAQDACLKTGIRITIHKNNWREVPALLDLVVKMNIMKSGINNQKELLKGKCGICDYLEVCGGCRQKFGC